MKGKKTSSEKIVDVITAKINNPDVSLRDIEKETGVNRQTTSTILKNDMGEVLTSSDKKKSLFDRNISILELGKRIIEKEIRKIDEGHGEVKIKSLNDIKTLSTTLEDAFKQNQLLGLKPTDIVSINGYKMLEEIKDGIKGKEDAYALLNKLKEDKE